MMRRFFSRFLAPVVLVAFFGAGCGSEPSRQIIEGTVTYDGQPLGYGTISFEPDTSKGNTGPQGFAEISKGQYRTDKERGPVVGPQIVRIKGWKTSPSEGMLGAPLSDFETTIDIQPTDKTHNFDIPAQGAPKGPKKTNVQ